VKYVIGGMKYSLAKTRTSVNFAIYLANIKKRKVLLVDADPSECATEYIRWRNENSNIDNLSSIQVTGVSLKTEVAKLEDKFDDIVIDSGIGENLELSLQLADKLIVPFSAKDLGLWTVWTLTNIETMIEKVLDTNSDIKAYSFFVTQKDNVDEYTDIIKTLEKSQYLEFLNSTTLARTMFGSEDPSLRTLKDMKEIKSTVSPQVIEIFDDISS